MTIEVEIDYEGTERGATQLERLEDALDRVDTAQGAAARSARRLSREQSRARGNLQTLRQNLIPTGADMRGLATAAGGAAIALGAMGAAAVAALNDLERRMGIVNRFSGSLDGMRERTGGLVGELDAMAFHSELAARGVNLAANDLNNLLVAAIERSAATGQDLNQVLQQMLEAFGNGSAEALGRYGVSLEQGQTKTEAITSALEQMDEQWGDVSSAADTAGGRVQQFGVALDDATTRFGAAITESGVLEQSFTSLFNAVSDGSGDFSDAMDAMIRDATLFGAAAAEAIERVTDLVTSQAEGWRALASGDIEGAARAFASSQNAAANLVDGESIGRDVAARAVTAIQSAREARSGGPTRSRVNVGPTPRRGGGRRGERATDEIGPEEAFERQMQSEQEIRDRMAAREEERLATIAQLKTDEDEREAARLQELAEMERDKQQAEIESIQRQAELREELRDKEKEASRMRLSEARAEAQEMAGHINRIASAYIGAFQQAIEGQKSLEEAMLDATKAILKSIGEELVAKGIGKILEGIAEIPSPTAATKIGGGAAMVGFGIGLGAAGAAIPSGASQAEQPRQQPQQNSGGGGPSVINVIYGSQIPSARTDQQAARDMVRAIDSEVFASRSAA